MAETKKILNTIRVQITKLSLLKLHMYSGQ